ncbi:MAG: hypothetical protein ACREE9_05160 [Stellaceae bacterium]
MISKPLVDPRREFPIGPVWKGRMMRSKEITERNVMPEDVIETETEGLFEMANLYPETTGLPMTVWVSPRGSARHDVRVKVNMTHGNQMNIANTAMVGLRPMPRVIAGLLSPVDAQAVFQRVTMNADILVAYWQGQIDPARMFRALKSLPPPAAP